MADPRLSVGQGFNVGDHDFEVVSVTPNPLNGEVVYGIVSKGEAEARRIARKELTDAEPVPPAPAPLQVTEDAAEQAASAEPETFMPR